jgi:DNA helicase-2/ATP-dependent DNA helicase PcrA
MRAGATFEEAFEGLRPRRVDDEELPAPGPLLRSLAAEQDAGDAVAYLRRAGGLDDWFEQEDSMDGLDQFESEVLEHAQFEAAGMGLSDYLAELASQADTLEQVRDEVTGIELRTIHGAKGCEWPHVIVTACEDGQLPHKKCGDVTEEARRRGEGMEAERRLAYVAFTRALGCLEVHYAATHPSCFLTEAGIVS